MPRPDAAHVVIASLSFALVACPGVAGAQDGSVTLSVRSPVVSYGREVEMSGRLTPPGVRAIVVSLHGDGDSHVVASGRTTADGSYALAAVARAPGSLVATAGPVSSPPVTLTIRPRLRARLEGLRVLGAPLVLAGRLRPADAGRLRAVSGGAGRPLEVTSQGSFRTAVPALRTGRVCARLTLSPRPGFTAAVRTRCAAVRVPVLARGARGAVVRYLQTRLTRRHYALLRVSGVYGADTQDAVYAFEKVEGLARDGVAGPAVWRRMLSARTPRAARGGSHIEVDKARQVLFEVRDGRVSRVAHVSTGATGNTPVGTWRIYAKAPGFNALGMFDSMYFQRGFAIHGYRSVPPYPASHGCVRVPLWLAPALYARWPIGSSVIVR